MSSRDQQFAFAILVQLFLPLMPFMVEFWITGRISNQTFSITAAMYSISIGVATRNVALLGLGILVAMAFSCVFGFVLTGGSTAYPVGWPALVAIFSFMVIHGTERYNRHVGDGEKFIDFGDRGA